MKCLSVTVVITRQNLGDISFKVNRIANASTSARDHALDLHIG